MHLDRHIGIVTYTSPTGLSTWLIPVNVSLTIAWTVCIVSYQNILPGYPLIKNFPKSSPSKMKFS